MSDSSGRAIVSVIEGLAERSPDGLDRARYCAALTTGAELTLAFDGRVVAVLHEGRDIGRVPAHDGRVASELAAGRRLRCVVLTVETGGLIRRKARRIEIEIVPVDDARFSTAVRWVTEGSTAAVRAASDLTVGGARLAGDALTGSPRVAMRAVSGTFDLLVRKPARGLARLGRGMGDAAGAPVRAVRRLVRNVFLAAVTILVLILAIVVVWRLPSLPGFGPSLPTIPALPSTPPPQQR